MNNKLLAYYESELETLKVLRNETRGKEEYLSEPHVDRLIESSALLNARMQESLDDSFSELTNSLLDLAFPDYLRCIPSLAIVDLKPKASEFKEVTIPEASRFKIDSVDGKSYNFRTVGESTLYPLKIDQIDIKESGEFDRLKCCLEISISLLDRASTFNQFDIKNLNFFVEGEGGYPFRLFDAIVRPKSRIRLTDGDNVTLDLDKSCLSPIGTITGSTALPYKLTTYSGYKSMTEFFAYPQLFNRFEIRFPENTISTIDSNTITIQVFLEDFNDRLKINLSHRSLSLFTLPMVNLYQSVSEPIKVDFLKKHYRVLQESLKASDSRVFCIDRVREIGDKQMFEVPELFFEKYKHEGRDLCWQRVYDEEPITNIKIIQKHHSSRKKNCVLVVDSQVTDNLDSTYFRAGSNVTLDEAIYFPFNMALASRPMSSYGERNEEKDWRFLIESTKFSRGSLFNSKEPKELLVQTLELYNYTNNPHCGKLIDSIKDVVIEMVVLPVNTPSGRFITRGNKITITIGSEEIQPGTMAFFYSLESFLSGLADSNSFIVLEVLINNKQEPYVVFSPKWVC